MSVSSTTLPLGATLARGLGEANQLPWPLARASTLFELRYGKALVKSARRPGPVPVFGTNGQTGSHDTALFKGPGVVLGRKGQGPLGVEWVDEDFWVIDTAYALNVISNEVDLKFAYYLIKYVGLNHLKDGTSNPSLSRETFAAQLFPKPPLDEQRGIAATLSALDEKIESATRARDLIEDLISASFEDLIASSPVTRVPLEDLVSTTKGVSYKSVDLQESHTSLVTLKSFHRNGGYKANGLKPYVGPYKPQQVIAPGEIVVAQTDLTQGAEVVGRAVRVPADASAEVLVASLDLVIVRPKPTISREYLLGILSDESFRQHCRSRTSGTTVLHLSSDAIPAYSAPLVPDGARDEFSAFAQPLLARADTLVAEIEKLKALRDGLLPDILAGRVRVPKATLKLLEVVR
ncbi:restriction endonuclease subunit S [Wenjunlia tyrosinilytica]|uniref:Type I restriction-modification system subunit S n=1 Tax=Wenjunlia tyrosinilytica TaxID=1544741 RepID=A0A917ZKC5_9ACTN|nr:restriction endonuclease subunit S [Wenjunlia tyrosinilytica]GGO85356.1 type I restriction-modification system subunit S [Wenjunlia tyrosinilytica]